jgi:hypothetical protein
MVDINTDGGARITDVVFPRPVGLSTLMTEPAPLREGLLLRPVVPGFVGVMVFYGPNGTDGERVLVTNSAVGMGAFVTILMRSLPDNVDALVGRVIHVLCVEHTSAGVTVASPRFRMMEAVATEALAGGMPRLANYIQLEEAWWRANRDDWVATVLAAHPHLAVYERDASSGAAAPPRVFCDCWFVGHRGSLRIASSPEILSAFQTTRSIPKRPCG